MTFVGDEKRIRAQFCDLAIRDQSVAPEFEKLWTRAESTSSETGRPTFNSLRRLRDLCVSCGYFLTHQIAEALRSPRFRREQFLRVVFASVVIIIALSAVVVWLRNRGSTFVDRPHATTQATSTAPAEPRRDEQKFVATAPMKSHRVNKRRFVASRHGSSPTVKEGVDPKVVAFSNWQSPTKVFLQSPVTPVFKSLPAFNQSVKELESFLSNKEVKESKQ